MNEGILLLAYLRLDSGRYVGGRWSALFSVCFVLVSYGLLSQVRILAESEWVGCTR